MKTIQATVFKPFHWRAGNFPVWMPWVVGGIFVVIFMLRDYIGSIDGVIDHSVFWGRDFINVWTGGLLIREGRLDILYDLGRYADYQIALFGDIGPHNYSYPPVSYPLAAVFSLLPYGVALPLWLALTGALFVYAARPWWPRAAGSAWLALLTPAAIVNIWTGHYGFLIGALFLLGWRRLDDRPIRSGVFFGLMLIKPHLAILVPIVLAMRGDWRAIGSAAATVAALVLVTGLIYGWQPWIDYVSTTSGVQASMIDARGMFFRLMSPSVATAMMSLTENLRIAAAAQLIMSSYAIGLVVLAARMRMPRAPLALLVATCTFLALPYSFNYDLVVVVIGALTIMTRPGVSATNYRLALFGFLSPQVGMVLAIWGAPLMSLMLAGLAYVQFKLARDELNITPDRAVPAAAAAAR